MKSDDTIYPFKQNTGSPWIHIASSKQGNEGSHAQNFDTNIQNPGAKMAYPLDVMKNSQDLEFLIGEIHASKLMRCPITQ